MTAAILAAFCLRFPAALPGQIDHAAHAAGTPSELLAATVGAESTCNNSKVSRKGAIGYGQILPGGSAAKGHSAKQLRRKRLNLRLAAEHLARGLRLCKGSWSQAVAYYSGVWPCQDTTWSRWVVAGLGRAQQRIALEGRPTP
jgi:soluble lytic murein transglycosylase-like protein